MLPTKYLLITCLVCLAGHQGLTQYTSTSALSEGNIYKLSVENTGIYKIDHSFLSSIPGLDISAINPKNLQIWTQHGGLVPQSLTRNRVDDLQQIPLYIQGEQDGRFDQGDYILFYAEGADRYRFDETEIQFEKNVYDLNNYVFLKIGNQNGLRISIASEVFVSDYQENTESLRRHELDRSNLLGSFGGTQGSGKQWFGEAFAIEKEQDFSASFQFPHLVENARAELQVRFASRSSLSSSYDIRIDNEVLSRTISPTNTGNIEAVYARIGYIESEIPLNSTNPSVRIQYKPQTSSSEAWLDYIQMITEEKIVYEGQPIYIFRRDIEGGIDYGFQIDTDEQLSVWDISEQGGIAEIPVRRQNQFVQFAFTNNSPTRSFIAFEKEEIQRTPLYVSTVANQNLHGIQEAELAIVYFREFEEAALTLAEHRRNFSNMTVAIADVEDIYNEFGGGKQDPTAVRDFVKMIYDRDPHFSYLLLLGDATYDFRGIVNGLEYQNFVPTYQTDESLHPVEAFPSDDFFALLSDNEGDDSLDGALDIGVGRITCKTLAEANAVVNKIIHYDTSPDCLGEWRNRIGFAADDEDSNAHITQADDIARLTDSNHPEFVQQKVYFDAFNQESTPGGARYPDARSALVNNLFKGQLVLNYLGHGGPKGWAQERVFQVGDIRNLNNINKLPILITATCSFTGFDEPSVVSAGEEALLNPSGGAIALFSTVRAVYSSQNARITREVFRKIFTRASGERLRFGDIIRESQNTNSSDTISSNTRKFMLFGDPSQVIAMPRYKIELSEINDKPVDPASKDTIGALSRTSIKASIVDFNGNRINDFNGSVSLTVFDKSRKLKTLDNDGLGRIFEFDARSNILYKGSASVESGEFEMEFILPRDIDFEYGTGYLSFYASNGVDMDAGGYSEDIIIGGTSEEQIMDDEGPEISIYLNDRSFLSGSSVMPDALLIVDLSDGSGINLSSTSIGHDITAILDDDQTQSFVLNEFYTPAPDAVGEGTVLYELENLEPGFHSLKVKAWDILNNSSEATTEFIVAESIDGFIRNVINYPNPFMESTEFSFEHDLVGSNISIEIDIYTVSGRLVKSIQSEVFSSSGSIDNIPWDGIGDSTEILHEGLYFYKIKIYSEELNQRRESDFGKLVILK